MGDRDGRMRIVRWCLQQLRTRAGRRQDRAGGRLPCRVPAASGGAHLLDHAAPGDGQTRRAPPDHHPMTRVSDGIATGIVDPGELYSAVIRLHDEGFDLLVDLFAYDTPDR